MMGSLYGFVGGGWKLDGGKGVGVCRRRGGFVVRGDGGRRRAVVVMSSIGLGEVVSGEGLKKSVELLPVDPLPDDGAFLPIDLVDEDELGPGKNPRRRERKRKKNKKPIGYREYVKKIRKCYKAWKKMRGTYGIQELLVKLSYGLNVDWRNSMNVKALRRLFRAWRARGGAPSEDEYKEAVKMVTDPTITQEQIELGHRVVEALSAVKVWQRTEKMPDMETLRDILIDLATCGAYKEVRQVIKEMLRQEREVDSEMFYCLIHACVLGDHMEGAAATLKRMKSRKTLPSVYMYNYIIRAWGYSREQKYNRLIRTFEIEMKNRRIQPNMETYEVIFDAYSKTGDMISPPKTWESLRRKRIDPSVECYSGYINCYAGTGDVLTCRSLWTEMQQKGLEPSANTYGAMIRAFGSAGMIEEAKEMEAEMMEKGYRRTLRSYNGMILAHIKGGDMEAAMRKFIEMRETATTASVETYGLLVDGFAEIGETERAVAVYRHAIDLGLKPDLQTYNSVLKALAKAGRYEEAKKLILKFRKGRRVVPDDYSLKYLMDACANAGFLGGAKDAFHTTQMILRLRPCILTWNALLRAAAITGDLESAQLYFRKLKRNKRSRENAESYNWMVMAYAMNHDFEGMQEVLSEMTRSGRELNLDGCKAMVVAYRQVDDLKGASWAFEEMLRQRVKPDAEVCNEMIEMCLVHEELDTALNVFVDMQKLDVAPNTRTYNALIQVQARRGAIEEVRTVSDEMRIRNVEPDIETFCTRIRAFGDNGDLIGAIDVFLEMEDDDQYVVCPNSQVYAALIETQGRNNAIEGAESAFLRMWYKKGIPRDTISYTAMIRAYTSCGLGGKAVATYKEMEYMNIPVSVETYAAVIRAYGRMGDISMALKGFDELHLHGFEEQTQVINSLIAAHCDAGDAEEALKLLNNLVEKNGTTPDRKPNTETYALVLAALGFQGDVERAEALYVEMTTKQELKPSAACFTAMMDAHARREDFEGVRRWMETMREYGRKVGESAYVALIDAHGRRGEMDLVGAVFAEMKDVAISRKLPSYNAAIAAYCTGRELAKAQDLLQEMIEQDLKPNVTTYDTLLKGALAGGDHDAVEALYQRMQADDYVETSDVADECILSSRSTRGDEVGVESIFRTMTSPVVGTWNELFAAYKHTGQLQKLLAAFMKMCTKGVEPNTETFKLLTTAHCDARDVEGCLWSIRLWNESGLETDASLLQGVVRVFMEDGRKLDARLLMRECQHQSVSFDDEAFSPLNTITEQERLVEMAGPLQAQRELEEALSCEKALVTMTS